nr:uncharacterized protein LOC108128617 [Drosophila bipectinata]
MSLAEEVKWDKNHEKKLLDLWKENVQAMQDKQTCYAVYEKIAKILEGSGFEASWKDVETKIENWTERYRYEQKMFEGDYSTWEYYHIINLIQKSVESGDQNVIHKSDDAFVNEGAVEDSNRDDDCLDRCGELCWHLFCFWDFNRVCEVFGLCCFFCIK